MNPSQEARLQLGHRLRQVRENTGLTGRDFAARLGWAGSKVSRIETGKQSASANDVLAWAVAAGLPCLSRDELVAESRQVQFEYAAWRQRLKNGTATRQRAGIELAASTTLQRVFEPDIVPGLLQTRAYARGVLRRVVAFDGLPDDVEEGVRTRLRRQRLLADPAHHFQFLIGEAALHYRTFPPAVLTEQLEHLATTAKLASIELRILPLTAELPVMMVEGFSIYDQRQVRVETLNAELVYRERYDVERYERAFGGSTQ